MPMKKLCPLHISSDSGTCFECMKVECALFDQSDDKCGILSIPYEIARLKREVKNVGEIVKRTAKNHR